MLQPKKKNDKSKKEGTLDKKEMKEEAAKPERQHTEMKKEAAGSGRKRILTIQDYSCLGKCSASIALPILSAMGVETVLLPTAILSTHTGFSGVVKKDLSDLMLPIARHWKEESIRFDAVYTGYLGTVKEIGMVQEIIRWFREKDTLVLVDPVMGDHGKRYSGIEENYPKAYQALCAEADLILPNLTEACLLTDTEYPQSYDRAFIELLLKKLTLQGAGTVILTGISFQEGMTGAFGYDAQTDHFFSCTHEWIPAVCHGTGDIFSSVTAGALLCGCTREEALQLAADYTVRTIEVTVKHPGEPRFGVDFEATIPELIKNLQEIRSAK